MRNGKKTEADNANQQAIAQVDDRCCCVAGVTVESPRLAYAMTRYGRKQGNGGTQAWSSPEPKVTSKAASHEAALLLSAVLIQPHHNMPGAQCNPGGEVGIRTPSADVSGPRPKPGNPT